MTQYSNADIRVLLKNAADAAGLEISGWRRDCDAVSGAVEVARLADGTDWQPFLKNRATDFMGDALRLAVKLKLDINGQDSPDHSRVAVGGFARIELHKGDADVATCRAIVCTAAQVGRDMQASGLVA